MELTSPRMTAFIQTLLSAPISTSPITWALSSTNAVGCTTGIPPRYGRIISDELYRDPLAGLLFLSRLVAWGLGLGSGLRLGSRRSPSFPLPLTFDLRPSLCPLPSALCPDMI